ncbi:MAG: hypothetical protein M0R80_24955 [Proteobacteria bacterium]|jgi:hypothetical protein|nr:hypothetical protein [Pseudomonadota bacterium]
METLRLLATVALLTVFSGCSSDRRSSSAPDCGCDEPDGGECVDTDPPDPDGGVPGWRMTWAVQAGSSTEYNMVGEEIAWDLEPLSEGSVAVAGRYLYEAVFGAGEPNETILPHFSPLVDFEDENNFVALYDREGSLIWARGFGGAGVDAGARGIKQLVDGSLWVNGAYGEEVTFGLDQPTETVLVPGTFDEPGFYYNHALAWYSAAGDFERAIRASDTAYSSTLGGSAILPDDSVVVAGWFSVGIAFAPGTPEQTIFTTPDSVDEDVVVARFTSDGTLLWARRITGAGMDYSHSVVRLLGGDILLSGTYQQTVLLGEGEENETWLTCEEFEPDAGLDDDGEKCPFLAAYSEDGALLWAKDPGFRCASASRTPLVAAAPDGGFAVSGGFVGTGVLGQGEPNETAIGPTSGEDYDVVVARYDDDGVLLWARQIVDETDFIETSHYSAHPLAFLDSGELAIAGCYIGAPQFGLGEPNETVLPESNDIQFFVALFYPNGNLSWAIEQGGPSGRDVASSVAAYGDSTFFVGGSFGDTVTFGTSSEDEKTMTSSGDSEIFVLRFDRTTE